MQTFGRGARGFLVVALQEALERGLGRRLVGGSDGKYEGETMRGVIEFTRTQPVVPQGVMQAERALFGQAGPAVFTALGLEWPELFARCLGLTAYFEGTGFGGAEGPAETADSAGVTYGLIGFTSYNGELQELLRVATVENREEFEYMGSSVLGVSPYYRMLELIKDYQDNKAFELWALSAGGSVRPSVKKWLAALGEMPWMRHLQMQMAHSRYWRIAAKNAASLFGDPRKVSDRVYSLLFDIAVQNGGLKTQEVEDLQWEFARDPNLDETGKMHLVNTKLIDRLRVANRPAKIIEDVRSRKNCIVVGSGKVHGADVIVRGFAL